MLIYLTGAVTDLNSAIFKTLNGQATEAANACADAGERVDKILAILAPKLPEANDGR